MNLISRYKSHVMSQLADHFKLDERQTSLVELKMNVDKGVEFGDVSCNAAMVLAKQLGKRPQDLAQEIKVLLEQHIVVDGVGVASVSIAGPGFINIHFTHETWRDVACNCLCDGRRCFLSGASSKPLRYLLEYVSANPTGPLHFGHGRNGIIGDVLSRILSFLGHDVHREFYINDAGKQVALLAKSFQARCLQQLGESVDIPEGGYLGDYLVELAHKCVATYGESVKDKTEDFFQDYAKNALLEIIKNDLEMYGIAFDEWFSEKSLHTQGDVEGALTLLQNAGLLYEHEGAYWFKATEFGDDKDRVIKKANGELTYIAADIAYHKNKFDRGFDKIIDILGQDHHGYVKRLKATMQALGYDAHKLDVILYQLVSIKEHEEIVRMSKRAGTFTKLRDVIDTVGVDVTRFFFLNRKADAHLDFDLSVAMKKSDENPVYYIHYAFVRTTSVLNRAQQLDVFAPLVKALEHGTEKSFCEALEHVGAVELVLLRRILFLTDVLHNISVNYQTHVLSYYTWELANAFHTYYTNNRVIDPENIALSRMRLIMVHIVRQTLDVCLDLLGLSKPDAM